jgi:hypothetical protein
MLFYILQKVLELHMFQRYYRRKYISDILFDPTPDIFMTAMLMVCKYNGTILGLYFIVLFHENLSFASCVMS